MSGSGERGGALPATLVLVLLLLLVGLQVATTATVARLGAGRLAAGEEAYQAADAALVLAVGQPHTVLAAVVQSGTPLDLPAGWGWPSTAGVEVWVEDDDEADGDGSVDTNGRLFLRANGWSQAAPGPIPARRLIVAEAMVGGLTPLPAAVLDCSGTLQMCGGQSGCPAPDSRLEGGQVAALAHPEPDRAGLRQRLFVLGREVLRGAESACAAACGPDDDSLRRAAATALIRAIDGAGDAVLLGSAEVSRLLSNLLSLGGSESGPGTVSWWDGTTRTIADRALLVAVVEGLQGAVGHVPDLSGHPLPSFLSGTVETTGDGGLCRRLSALLPAALHRAQPLPASASGPSPGPPPGDGIFVVEAPLTVAPGDVITGRGPLIVRAPLTLPAGAALRWWGSIILDGGRLEGTGRVEVDGGVVDTGGRAPGVPGLDLGATVLRVRAAPDLHAAAWAAAGNVLLWSWEDTGGN